MHQVLSRIFGTLAVISISSPCFAMMIATTGPRPHADAHHASSTHPLTVHWREGVSREYALEILSHAETSWTVSVEQMGFLPPHGDGDLGGDSNIDLYIVTDLSAGIGGYAGFSGFFEETPRQDAYGYLVINNEIDARLRKFVVAHELFHLSQMAYDWWEDISFMEATATWITSHVFQDDDIYWRYFPFFNQAPYLALDYISIQNPYQYGAGLFSMFLDERYGQGDGRFIRLVWESLVQDDIENEPDFIDSITSHLPPNLTFGDAYHEFGIWRLLTGSRSAHGFFKHRSRWDARMDPWLELDTKRSSLPVTRTAENAVGPYAHAFLRIENDQQHAGSARAEVNVEGSVFAVSHLVISEKGMRTSYLGTAEKDSPLTFDMLFTPDDHEHFVILTNITDGTYDADTSPWTGSGFNVCFTDHTR